MKKILFSVLILLISGCTTASKCADAVNQGECEKESKEQLRRDPTVNRGFYKL